MRTGARAKAVVLALVLSGCAGARSEVVPASARRSLPGAVPPAMRGPELSVEQKRARVAREAARRIGPQRDRALPDAFSLVRSTHREAGIELPDLGRGVAAVRRLHALLARRQQLHGNVRPNPGDLAFFDDTHDENGDGRRNDPLTHVAIVEKVEEDGTVVLVTRVRSGVLRLRMNLARPNLRRDGRGRVLNHYLRPAEGNEPPRTAAQLFAGYALLTGPRDVAPRVAAR